MKISVFEDSTTRLMKCMGGRLQSVAERKPERDAVRVVFTKDSYMFTDCINSIISNKSE